MLLARRMAILSVFMLALCAPLTASSQNPTGPGVEIDCNEKNPEINVHPLEDPTVEITCTVSNPSSFEEQISVEKEWDGVEVDMLLEEDSFTLEAGGEEDFTVTFNGQSRLSSSLSYDFTLIATVTNVGVLDWPEQLATNASVSGDLGIATFGMVDLTISDKSTRTMASGVEIPISFQFQNNGNSDDKIRVTISNSAELEEAGFSFPAGIFIADDVDKDGISDKLELTVRSPADVVEDARYQITFQAASTNDDTAAVSEITLSIQLEATTGSGGLGGGLDEFSKDDAVLYGSIAGGVLFGIILIIAMSKALRRRANSQPMYVPPVDLEEEDDTMNDDEFDFGDLDDEFEDLLDDGEDLDDAFADL